MRLLLSMLHLVALLKVSSAAHALVVEVPDGVAVHVAVVVYGLIVRILVLLLSLLVRCAIVRIFDAWLVFQNFGSLLSETECGGSAILRLLLRHLVEIVERVVLEG